MRIDVERRSEPATGISQAILPVPELLKTSLLKEMLKRGEVENALVFTRTKHRANRLFEKLERAGISCDRIHGNRSQPQREAALAGFKHGRIKVLVATDIAARGIDVAALPHVINFDVPVVPDDYIHRVGRTARAGMVGDALTFASPAEQPLVTAIERAVGRNIDSSHDRGLRLQRQARGAAGDPGQGADRRPPSPQVRGTRPWACQGSAQAASRRWKAVIESACEGGELGEFCRPVQGLWVLWADYLPGAHAPG